MALQQGPELYLQLESLGKLRKHTNPRAPPPRAPDVINREGVRHASCKRSPGDSNVQQKLKNH